MGGEHGYDGGKKINGRKRHILVDVTTTENHGVEQSKEHKHQILPNQSSESPISRNIGLAHK
jgi:hypothetical protein